MARKVFFSFHFARDAWKVSQVRNAYVVDKRGDSQPILDKAAWEAIKRKGDAAIERWIAEQMSGCSTVVVLYGAETYKRPWVKHEIQKAHREGRGLLGVSLTGMRGADQVADYSTCPSPFDGLSLKDASGRAVAYPTYGWVANDGRANLDAWVEQAAKRAGY